MATDLQFIKSSHGLMPSSPDAVEWFERLKFGTVCIAKMTVPRNYRFHKKFFAMLKVSYESWDNPVIQTPYGEAQCTMETFRNDVTVLAGYHELTVNTKGEAKYKAKSIKFAKMDEDEFGKLYSAVVTVILKHFLPNWAGSDMDRAVDNFLGEFG